MAALVLCCVMIFGSFGAAHALTIEEAIRAALKKHPSVEAAQAFLDAQQADIEAQRSGYFPTFNASLTGGRIYGANALTRGLSVERGAGYSGFGEGSSSLTQPIFDGFGTESRVAAAEARAHSADMDLIDARENLALKTAQAYLDVMRTHSALYIIRDHINKIDDYLGRIEISVQEGVLDEAEYQQALDVKYILEGFISEYEGQALSAEAQFNEAVGMFPDGDMRVPHPDDDFIIEDIDEAVAVAKDVHPTVKSAEFSAEAIKYGVDEEMAALYPSLSSELSYLKSDRRELLGGETVDARAVLRMNWNFELGGGLFDRVEKKRLELGEAIAKKRDVSRRLEGVIRQSYAELDTAEKLLGHVNRRYELNSNFYSTLKTQFEGARVSLLELMQADNQLFNIKLEKLNTEYRVLASQYKILASLGQLQNSVEVALHE
ncbi:MAG: TolC family protein [Pseudomonadota bacterium]